MDLRRVVSQMPVNEREFFDVRHEVIDERMPSFDLSGIVTAEWGIYVWIN